MVSHRVLPNVRQNVRPNTWPISRRIARAALMLGVLGVLALPSAAIASNPLGLVVDVKHPYLNAAEVAYTSDYTWCPQAHWTPWNGDWAFDIWKDNGTGGVGLHPNASCGQDVYLRVTPGMLPGGIQPDSIRARVVNVSSHPYACASQSYAAGGYQQAFEIYATYQGTEYRIGWVLYAHLDNMVYNYGDWIADPTQVRIGTVFWGNSFSGCWGGCHVHMEFYNDGAMSCYQNACPPYSGIPTYGDGSVAWARRRAIR